MLWSNVVWSRSVGEHGPSDTPLDAHRIFTRFHKETTADGGTGLGLAIAKAISDLYGLKLEYRFEGMHVFSVRAGS